MGRDRLKIIVIAQKYLNKRAIFDNCLDELSKSFDLEYWDISPLLKQTCAISDLVDREWAKTISTQKKFEQNLKKLPKDTLVIISTFKQKSTYPIHHEVGRYVKAGIIPIDNSTFWEDCSNGRTLISESYDQGGISQNSIERPKESLYKRIKRRIYKIEPLMLFIKYFRYMGDYRYKQLVDSVYYQKCIKSYKHIFTVGMSQDADYLTCSPHFDVILELDKQQSKETKPYIVFLDSYYPMHPDWQNRVPEFDWAALQEPYFNSLNRFFDKIEKEFGCEVVIGAHPNALYDNNPYGKRKCVKYKSVELVKGAKAVMMHATNSATFVAYYDKPFCFLTNDALKAGDFPKCMYGATVNMAKALGVPLIDTDHVEPVTDIFAKMEPKTRKLFLDNYFGDYNTRKCYADQFKDAFVDINNRIKQ